MPSIAPAETEMLRNGKTIIPHRMTAKDYYTEEFTHLSMFFMKSVKNTPHQHEAFAFLITAIAGY
jgi:hypothetical protein